MHAYTDVTESSFPNFGGVKWGGEGGVGPPPNIHNQLVT